MFSSSKDLVAFFRRCSTTYCHTLLSGVCLRFGLFLLFSLCFIHIDILSPIHSHNRHIWPFHSLTALIIWLFCCSALLLFIFVNIFCIMRCSGVKIMSCMYSHESSKQRKLIPSLLQATLHTQKRGWGKVQWWLKSLVLGTYGHKMGQQRELWQSSAFSRNFQVLLFTFRPPWSRNTYSPHYRWQNTTILYPKCWLHLQRFGGFYGLQPLQTHAALILNLSQHYWAKTLSF